jgi:hypothetical protein
VRSGLLCGAVLVIAGACGGQIAGTGADPDGGNSASDSSDVGASTKDAVASADSGTGGGVEDGAATDGPCVVNRGFAGSYDMICVLQITNDSVADAVQLAGPGELAYCTGSPTGTLTITMTPLEAGASSASQTVGPASTHSGIVETDAACSIDFGPTTLPAAASPLGAPLDFSSLTLAIKFGPGADFCANLSGALTSPVTETLAPEQNICMFVGQGGGPWPMLTQSQVHCP